MITVDTNVIAYLLLPGDRTAAAEAALARDPDWIAPPLWYSELLNILCLYARKAMIELDQAVEVYEQAVSIVADAGSTPLRGRRLNCPLLQAAPAILPVHCRRP